MRGFQFILGWWRQVLVGLLVVSMLPREAPAQTAGARLVPFRQGTRWGYADAQRRLVLPLAYDEVGPFVEGAAWVRQGLLYGYIDTTGHALTLVQYNRAGNFGQGRATVELGGKTFVIGSDGQPLTAPPEPELETDYLEQGDLVRRQGKVGFRFTAGSNTVVPTEYDEIRDLHHDGLLLVRQGPKWGVLNGKGKLTLPVAYDAIRATAANGFAYPVVELAGRFGYLDDKGGLLTKLKYTAAEPFAAEVARVTTPDGKTGYLDNRGREYWQE
ncbi:WG repeat-containing protein [Hymenobacter sp. BT186]|uniref:WG repeat-containing protein n=1 Tax=Hymenobacter telluris TaxID=2816474 RepID=A0A939JDC5_9BACT|nr:WG repeat-containing protein [Hymenobacter telluris]MBO0361106.1 WG repeat-containing protein [Hymenobacter telluris]MBW3377134.1 WG repeat-containing protein [Hymenobacter norwichensis]